MWITLGTVVFAANDVVIKTLGRKIDPFELAFFRYVIGLVIMSPIFIRIGVAGLRTKRIGLHLMRLSMACVAMIGVLISVINLPLATVTSLSFSRILFTTFVAVLILKELVSARRWLATAIGFVGVVIMVRPSADGVDTIALIAIASAMTFAVANVLIRVLSRTEPPIRILFYYHLGGSLVFVGPAIYMWVTPVGMEWALVGAIGVLTTIGMVAFVRGFAVGEASVIGPMEYTRLIYAAVLGFLFFAEIPDPYTILGAMIIVGATTFIARVEARAAAGT
ncbi:MAG: DMT family transporter [Rhodospirillales bacterium]|nr:DMT family transporter [Rhodospirillales bacterium]